MRELEKYARIASWQVGGNDFKRNRPTVGTRPHEASLFTMQKQLILDILGPGVPTLDNYAGDSNAPALHALRHQTMPGRAIYLWGPPGSGRTHLLRAVRQAEGCLYLQPRTEQAPGLQALADAEQQDSRLIAIDDGDTMDPGPHGARVTLHQQ